MHRLGGRYGSFISDTSIFRTVLIDSALQVDELTSFSFLVTSRCMAFCTLRNLLMCSSCFLLHIAEAIRTRHYCASRRSWRFADNGQKLRAATLKCPKDYRPSKSESH